MIIAGHCFDRTPRPDILHNCAVLVLFPRGFGPSDYSANPPPPPHTTPWLADDILLRTTLNKYINSGVCGP